MTEQLVDGVERLSSDFEGRGAAVERVLVENGALGENSFEGSWHVIEGSNRRFEFSGYEEGVAALTGRNDFIILLNDRWDSDKRLMTPLAIARLPFRSFLYVRAILGQVDRYPLSVTVLGAESASWVRTNAVVLPSGVMNELRPLDLRGLVDPATAISESHRNMIHAYIKGTGPMAGIYKARWYRANADIDLDTYLRKEASIFLEHALSARAKSKRIQMLDMWEHSALPPRPG